MSPFIAKKPQTLESHFISIDGSKINFFLKKSKSLFLLITKFRTKNKTSFEHNSEELIKYLSM